MSAGHSRARIAALAALLLAVGSSPAAAQVRPSELSGYLTLASDLRRHGLSELAGNAALEIGLDYQHTSGFFAGASAHNIAYPAGRGATRADDVAIGLYAGRVFERGDWRSSVAVGHYRYPGLRYDYAYTELDALVSFRERVFYRLSLSPDYLSFGVSSRHHELGTTFALPAGLELGAALGRFEAHGDALPDYTHYNLGLSRLFSRFAADLRYYGTSHDVYGVLGTTAADRWVLSLSYAIRRRR